VILEWQEYERLQFPRPTGHQPAAAASDRPAGAAHTAASPNPASAAGLPAGLKEETMPLDQTTLQTKIKAAFEKAKNTPPPADPNDADAVQTQILADLSADLADAILEFVQSGDISGVITDVKNDANVHIGNGTQTNTVKLT
jgi:hypothetical protein